MFLVNEHIIPSISFAGSGLSTITLSLPRIKAYFDFKQLEEAIEIQEEIQIDLTKTHKRAIGLLDEENQLEAEESV